jgi:hypothetical protein
MSTTISLAEMQALAEKRHQDIIELLHDQQQRTSTVRIYTVFEDSDLTNFAIEELRAVPD